MRAPAESRPRARPRFLPRIESPAHPIFVHFTVALTSASLAFDTGGVLLGEPTLGAAGWWSLAVALVATIGTVVSGAVARLRLPMEEGEARRYLRAHMALGPVLLGLLVALCAWRAALWSSGTTATWPYVAAAGGVVVVTAVQGFLGGELVYRWGADVRGRYPRLPSDRRETPAEGSGADEPAGVGATHPATARTA